jgi:two-component system phosphate regulon response regulator PhoB
MSTPRILIVEDDDRVAYICRRALERQGWRVHVAASRESAVRAFDQFEPDLILLDLLLADKTLSGFDVLAEVRARPGGAQVQVVILSGQAAEAEQLRGFDLGADNYLVKPVSETLLVARVAAQLRRGVPRHMLDDTRIFRCGELEIDLGRAELRLGPEWIGLALIQKKVLVRLLETPGRFVSVADLLHSAWGQSGDGTHLNDREMVKATLGRLLRKFKRLGAPRLITSRRRIGYAIAEMELIYDDTHARTTAADPSRAVEAP